MSKIFILEGPDGAGKTTAGIKLAKEFSGVYLHNNEYKRILGGDILFQIFRSQLDFGSRELLTIAQGIPIFIDRSWISEMIYGVIYRGKSRVSDWQHQELVKICSFLKVHLINFRPSWETVERNWMRNLKEQTVKSRDEIKDIYNLYSTKYLADDYGCVTYEHNYELDSFESLCTYVHNMTEMAVAYRRLFGDAQS